jgi:hypothetical protein
MSKLIKAIFMACCLFSVSMASLDSGLVNYWPLDANGNDMVGGNNLTNVGSVTFAPGKINNGAVLSGGKGFTSSNTSLLSGTADFSVSFWIYPTNLSPFALIARRSNYPPDFQLIHNANKIYLQTGLTNIFLSPATPLSLNTWQMVTMTRGSNLWNLYINDTNRIANESNGVYIPSGQTFTIGKDNSGNDPVIGTFDEVRIYNRALSAAEVGQLYNQAFKPVPNNYINIASLADMNSNGYPEIVGLATEAATGKPLVKIFDGGTNDSLKQIYFFDSLWTPKKVVSFDINNDGNPKISVLASKGDSTRIECRKVSDGSIVKTIILP